MTSRTIFLIDRMKERLLIRGKWDYAREHARDCIKWDEICEKTMPNFFDPFGKTTRPLLLIEKEIEV